MRGLLIAVLGLGMFVGAEAGITVYVDAGAVAEVGDGSRGKPFATLQKAQERVRELLKGESGSGGIVVEVVGSFRLYENTLRLGREDSGRGSGEPVVWRAGKRGAYLTGGRKLEAGGFRRVSERAVLERVKGEVRDKLVEFDLRSVGVDSLKPLPVQFSGWWGMEIFQGGKALQLARWPNTGWAEFGEAVDRGVKPIDRATGEWEHGVRGGTFEFAEDDPLRWDIAKGVWLNGFWCFDWANETLKIGSLDKEKRHITTEGIHTYGIGNPWRIPVKRRYYALNLLEELDQPGEWFVDRESCKLYLYPVEGNLDDIIMCDHEKPLVEIKGAKDIVFEGFELQYNSVELVAVSMSERVVLRKLKGSLVTKNLAYISAGSDCGVEQCEFYGAGGTCLSIYGGNREKLVSCGHYAVHNHLHHGGRLQRTQGKALTFSGVGIWVAHNLIHDTPYIAVTYGGNENVFEYNEVHSAMMESDDGGGLYTGRHWCSQGNIVRYNFLHHFGVPGVEWQKAQGLNPDYEPLKKNSLVMGVYLDDCDSGDTIYGNIFYKTGRAAFVGGGRYNTIENNVFIDCLAAFHLDDRGLKRARPGEGTKDGWDLLAKLERVKWKESPWKERYPHLLNIMEDDPKLPLHNAYRNNVIVNCEQVMIKSGTVVTTAIPRLTFENNLVYGKIHKSDADVFPQGEVWGKRIDFMEGELPHSASEHTLKSFALQESDAFKAAAPWFKRIPVEQIGRQD